MRFDSFFARAAVSLAPLVFFLSSTSAQAQDAAFQAPNVEPTPIIPLKEDAPPPPEMHTRWYGWQTLLVDASAVAILGLGSSSNSSTVSYMGFGTYALGPPIVHLAQGRPSIALADFGLRLGAPLLLGGLLYGLGAASDRCDDSLCLGGAIGAIFGVFVGTVAAVVIDASVLARERVPTSPKSTTARWTPTIGAEKNGGTVGVVGTF